MPSSLKVCHRTTALWLHRPTQFPQRAGQHLARAVRVARAIPDATLTHDLMLGMDNLRDPESDAGAIAPAPDLDTAIALIELGGHPRILGREALAVLDAAGCARAVALVAAAAGGPRVIESRGWTGLEAAAAAAAPDQYDLIPLGRHRDEPWQLVVDPRPELDHRCTLIAIRKLIGTALTLDRYRREEKQRAALWPAEALDGDPESIWVSEQMAELLSVARRIAPTPLSILLTGETGHRQGDAGARHPPRVGSRLPARSSRSTAPPCRATCSRASCSATARGPSPAPTRRSPASSAPRPAVRCFSTRSPTSNPDVQPKLLRFLETHEIHPLGEPQPIKVDVRVIAATNARLEQLVADGRFREDLFYRLNVVRLKLPPLRERREEIPPLVDHYLRKFGDEQKKGRLTLSDETLEYLLLYSWPGNLRQLANEVRRMVAMAEANSDADARPAVARHPGVAPDHSGGPAGDRPGSGSARAHRPAAAGGGPAAGADDGAERARSHARARRRGRAHPGDFEKGPVPETEALGPASGLLISPRRAPASPDGCGG